MPRALLATLLLSTLLAPAMAEPTASIGFAFSAKPQPFWTFWQGETPAGYREKMAATILPLAASPGFAVRTMRFDDPALPDRLELDRAPWPFHQHLCRQDGVDWLVSFRVSDERPLFSPFQGDVFGIRGEVPSAHWPELYWISYDCKNGIRNSGRPILSPRREDRFVFETELKNHVQTLMQQIISPAR